MQVRKRNGNIVDFDESKISNAIRKAFIAAEVEDISNISDSIENIYSKDYLKNYDDICFYKDYSSFVRGFIAQRFQIILAKSLESLEHLQNLVHRARFYICKNHILEQIV